MNRFLVAAAATAVLLVVVLLTTGSPDDEASEVADVPEPETPVVPDETPERGDPVDMEDDSRQLEPDEALSLDDLPESDPPDQPEPTPSQLEFSGYVWNVRDYDGAPTSLGTWERSQAYVRGDDAMVLRLSSEGDHWRNAEVYTETRGFGYGVYRWVVEGRLDTLHPNTVLGLFTYESNAPGNREIDIEATRWGRDAEENMYATKFNVRGEPVADGWVIGDQANTRHAFIWEPGLVTWISEDAEGNSLYTREVATEIAPENERVHMNLWIFEGRPPEVDTEVVVTDFSFTPLDEIE